MKTCNVLASLLFGSLAAAVPLDRRALATKTEVVWETVVVYTTVWDGQAPKTEAAEAAEATSSAGLFYEKPSRPAAQPTHKYTQPAAEPSSVYTPPPQPETKEPEPAPEPTSVYSAPPAPPAPKPTSVYTPPQAPPAPKPSTPAAPAPSAPASNPGGQEYHGDLTIYDGNGNTGACGIPITDDMFAVALAEPTWGKSTWDTMTGESSNPWCGQKITIEYNGNQIEATIQDLCPYSEDGCKGADIDLTFAAWKKLTGTTDKTRFQANWWKSS